MKVKDLVELKKNEVLGEKEEVFSADDMNKAYNEAISNALEAPIDLSKLAEQFDREKLASMLPEILVDEEHGASGAIHYIYEKNYTLADAIIQAIKEGKVFK